jgi:hypothetical protein
MPGDSHHESAHAFPSAIPSKSLRYKLQNSWYYAGQLAG